MREGYALGITVGGSLPRGRPATIEEATLAIEHMGGQLDYGDYGWGPPGEDVLDVYTGSFPDDVADDLDAWIDTQEEGIDGWLVNGPDGEIDVEVL